MDEQQQPAQPVMDVKPPEQSTPQVPQNVVENIEEAPTRPAPSPESPVSPPPSGETSENPEAGMATDQPANSENSVKTEPGQENVAPQPKTVTAPRKHNPTMQIILALVVGLALAALSVYAYNATNKKDDTSATNSNSSVASADDSQATASAIDETTAEIDQALNQLDAAKDFPDSDLSDETLSL